MKIRRINLLQNYLFEHSSNPSLRKAIEEPNSEATNQRASQPTNPLFNVATIINHLGYLYFCISLWDSRHIQAIGAKFSSLSIYIYIRDDGSITRLAWLGVYPIPWLASRAPHPFPPNGPRAPGFSRISSGNTAADNTTTPPSPPPPMSRASQPSFSRPFSTRHPFDPLVLAELLQLREPVWWRNRIPLPAKVNRDGTWFSTFRGFVDLIFFPLFFFFGEEVLIWVKYRFERVSRVLKS